MNIKFVNPAASEMPLVIRFLCLKIIRMAEIYRQIIEIHGNNVMNDGKVSII